MKDKNIYALAYKVKGESEEHSKWILAMNFVSAANKAKAWVAAESKKTGEKLHIDKIEYEGDIDIF